MKIFSWVHKTFHPNASKDRDAGKIDHRKDLLINQAAHDHYMINQIDQLDDNNWRVGVLTIGTLGILKSFNNNQKKLYMVLESEKEERKEDEEGEEDGHEFDHRHDEENDVNPLLTFATSFKHNIDDIGVEKHDSMIVSDVDENKKNIGERITLADLLLVDRDDYQRVDDVKMKLEPCRQGPFTSNKTYRSTRKKGVEEENPSRKYE